MKKYILIISFLIFAVCLWYFSQQNNENFKKQANYNTLPVKNTQKDIEDSIEIEIRNFEGKNPHSNGTRDEEESITSSNKIPSREVSTEILDQNLTFSIEKWELDSYSVCEDRHLGIWPQPYKKGNYKKYKKFGFSRIRSSFEGAPSWGHFEEIINSGYTEAEIQFQIYRDYLKFFLDPNLVKDSLSFLENVNVFYIDEPLERELNKKLNPFSYSEIYTIANTLKELGKKLVVGSYRIQSPPTDPNSQDLPKQYLKLCKDFPNTISMAGYNYKYYSYSFWEKFRNFFPAVNQFYTNPTFNKKDWSEKELNDVKNLVDELWLYAARDYIGNLEYVPTDSDLKLFCFKAWKTDWLNERIERKITYEYLFEGEGDPTAFNLKDKQWKLSSKISTDSLRVVDRNFYDFNECPELSEIH